MVTISFNQDKAVFEVEGFDRLWALRSRLEIPLAHIRAVRADPEIARQWWHGFRIAGAYIPGILSAGTFYQDRNLVFWDVHDPENTIVVDLDHERYAHLVIEVEDPRSAVAMLNDRLQQPGE
jgi:hypothetical protein